MHKPFVMTEEHEAQKKAIYERMSPRRRKFIDRIGYDRWNPFAEPKDPIEWRTDGTQRTTQQLVNEFLKDAAQKGPYGKAYSKGATECALGVINKDEKYMGIFDFCQWYHDLLKKEGHIA